LCCTKAVNGSRLFLVNLHDWIDELCDELDIEVEVDEALVLDVARDAAHSVERRAAPISTFLLGYAAARANGNQAETERLAGLAAALAARWDKSPDDLAHEDDEVDVEVELDAAVGAEVVAELAE
jgi:hypothetical protein